MTLIHSDSDYTAELKKLSETIEPGKTLLRTRHGYFLAINHDLLVSVSLMKYGELCELEWELMKPFLKPEMVVVDAGSHLGTYLVPFARRVGPKGKVIGFEPQPVIFESLQSAVILNKVAENTVIYNACIGDMGEDNTHYLTIEEPDYNHIGHFGGVPFAEAGFKEVSRTNKTVHSEVKRLDDFFKEPRFDFLKIDVEGMERDVLTGGENTIKKFHPVMFIENCRRNQSAALMQTIFDLGYRAWWHTGRLFNPNNFSNCAENVFGQRCNTNVLCIPRDRAASELPEGFPWGLVECTDANHCIIQENGQIIPSMANWEPKLK